MLTGVPLGPMLNNPTSNPLTNPVAGSFIIKGVTLDGKVFRPSDWADRLCGVMACFNEYGSGPGAALQYSPWVQPHLVEDIRCVCVDSRIFDAEPMAYRFLLSFARDNQLVVLGDPKDAPKEIIT